MKDIPRLGLGFWQIEKKDAKRVFLEGYEVGYRHFDTAIAYENESEIGEAIKENGQKKPATYGMKQSQE